MTASTTNQAPEENVPKALENPLESTDTTASSQTQAAERLLDATRPATAPATTDKPLADKIAETITKIQTEPNDQSGLTKEQRTTHDIQRLLREELAKKSPKDRQELARILEKATLPGGWKIKISPDGSVFQIGKDKSGTFAELARIQSKDVPVNSATPSEETGEQSGARLAERVKAFAGNPKFMQAWAGAINAFVGNFAESDRAPGGKVDQFIKSFNDRLSQDVPPSGVKLERTKDGLAFTTASGRIETNFSAKSDTATLAKRVIASQTTPEDLVRTIQMEGVTAREVSEKFGNVLRAEAVRNSNLKPEELAAKVDKSLTDANTGFRVQYDTTTGQIRLIKADTNTVLRRVEFGNVKYSPPTGAPRDQYAITEATRLSGRFLEPLTTISEPRQLTGYADSALRWLNQPGRPKAEQEAFVNAIKKSLPNYPELANLKLDASSVDTFKASLESVKRAAAGPDLLFDVPIPAAARIKPEVATDVLKTFGILGALEQQLRDSISGGLPVDQTLSNINGLLAQTGQQLFMTFDQNTQQMVLRKGPNPTDAVAARFNLENLAQTSDPVKAQAETFARPFIGMNSEQRQAYFAKLVEVLAKEPDLQKRGALVTAINNQLADPKFPETKGLSLKPSSTGLALMENDKQLIDLPFQPATDQPATRPPVNLDAILGADKAKLTTPELQAAALKFFDAATPANEKLKMAEILANGGIKSLTAKDGDKTRTLTFQKSGPYMHVYANDNGGRNTIYLRGIKRGEDYVQQVGKNGRQVGFYGDRWTKSVGKDSILGSNVATAADRPADAPSSEVNAVTDANRLLGLTPIVANDSAAFQTRMDQRIRFSDPTDLTPKSVVSDFNAYLKASLGNPPQLDQAKAQKLAEAYSAALRAEALLNPPPKLGADAAQNKALMDAYSKSLAERFNAGISPEFKQLLQVAPSTTKDGIDTVAIQLGQNGSFQTLFEEPRDLLGKPLVQFAEMMKRAKTDGERAQIFGDFLRRETIQNPTSSAAEMAKRFDDIIQAAKIPDLKVEIARTGSSDAQIVLRKPNSAEPIIRIDPKNVARKDASGIVKENYQQLAGRIIEPLAALKGDEISAHMQRLGASMKDMPAEQRAKLIEAIKAEIAKRPELAHLSIAEKPDQKGMTLSSTRPEDKPIDIKYENQVSDVAAPVAATTPGGAVDLKAIVGEQRLATLKPEQQEALQKLLRPGATQPEQVAAIEALAKSGLKSLKIKDGNIDRTLSFGVKSAGGGKSYIAMFATDDRGKSRVAIRGMNDGKNNYIQQGKASFYGDIWTKQIGNKSILTGANPAANPTAPEAAKDRVASVPPIFDAKKIDWNTTNNVITPDVVSTDQPIVPKVMESGTPLNSDAVVKSLVDTGLTGKSNIIFNSADHARIRAMLKDYSPDQLKEIKAKFQQTTGTNFDEALAQKFSGSELNELRYLGEGLNDRTTRLMKAFEERANGGSRGNTVVEKDFRDTLATMNKAEIDALDAEFKKRNGGKSLLDAIRESNFSSTTKQALQVYMKGSDQLGATEYKTLIALAKDVGWLEPVSGVDMFKEATRFMKAEIRAELKDELVAAAHSWNFSINPFSYTSTELEDYARYGGLAAATEVSRQTSVFSDWFTNKEGIRNALAAMSPAEHKDFADGKDLAKGIEDKTIDVSTLNADQQRKLKYFQDLQYQIDRSPEHARINFTDIALYGGEGSIVSKIAAPDNWFNRSANEFLDIVDKQFTEEDWKRATNPETAAKFREEFKKALEANVMLSGFFTSDINRAMEVFDAKAKAKTWDEAKGITRDIVSALKDKVGIFSTDQAGMLDVILNMTDAQKQRLATDPEYKKQVIAEIYAQHAGTFSVNGFGLGNIWSGIAEIPYNPITSGFVKSYVPLSGLFNPENWVGAGRINYMQRELALRAIDRFSKVPPEKTDLLDKLAYHQAKGSSAAEITADIQKAIKEDPKLVESFKNLQGKDKALADRVMSDMSWSFSHIFSSNEFDEIIKPIVTGGHADLSQAQRLFSGWTSNDLKGVADFLSAGNQKDWDAVKANPGILSFLNKEEQQVVQKIAAQNGKIQLEDEVRIAILTGNLAKLKELQQKSPNDLLVARQNYETKYGTVLTDDLRKMRKPEANTAATLFEGPKTAQQAYDDARDRVYASMNQTFDLAGASASQLQGRIDDFAARLTEAGVLKQNMTPEEVKQFNLNVMKALEQYQHSKEAIAEGIVNTAVLAAAVAVAVFTLGTGSGVSALMVAAVIGGGAIGQPLVKELIMQGDYDLFGKQGLKDSALGAFTMALALIPPSKLIQISGALTATARATLANAIKGSPRITEALQRAAFVLVAVKNAGAPIIDGASTQLSRLTTFTSEAISKAIGESAFTGLVKEAGLQGVGKEAFDTFNSRLAERLTQEVAKRGGTALSPAEIKGITSEVLTNVLKEAAETQGTAQLGKVTEFLMAEAVSGSAPRYETALRMISKIPGMDSAKAQELAALLVKEVNVTLKSAEGGNLKAMFARLGGEVAETMPEWQKAALTFMTKNPGTTHILTQTGFGTVLGGTDGLVRGAVDWDPKLSISQNLAKIAEHAGTGMFMGTVFAGGLTTAISGRSIMRGTFKYPHISTDNFRNLNSIDRALAESGETFTPFKLEKVGNVFESSLDRKITIGQTGAKDVTFTVPGNINASIENGMLKGKSLIVNGERIADDIPFSLKNGDIIQFGENGHPVLFMRTEGNIALTSLVPAEKLGIKAATHNLVDSQPAVIHPGKRTFTIGAEAGTDVSTDIAGALRVTREGGYLSKSTNAIIENTSDRPITIRLADGAERIIPAAADGVPPGKVAVSGEFKIIGEAADVRVSLTRSGSIVEQVQKGAEFSGPTRLAAAPVVLKPDSLARNTVVRAFTDTGTAVYDTGLAAKRMLGDAGSAIYNRDFKALIPTWSGTRAALAEVPGMLAKAPSSALRIAGEYGYWGIQKAGQGLKYGYDGIGYGLNRGGQSWGRIAEKFAEPPRLRSLFNPNSPESTLFVSNSQLKRLGFTEAPESAAEIAKLRASIARGTSLSKEEIALVKDQINNVPRIFRNAETGVELEVRGGRIFRQIKEGENFAIAWDGNNVVRMNQNGTWYNRVPAEKGARVGNWLRADQLAPEVRNGEQLQYLAIASGVKKIPKPLGADEQTAMQALLSRKKGEITEGVELKPLSKKEERLLASLERRQKFWETQVTKTTDFAEAQRIAGEKGKILYTRGDSNLTEHAFSPSNPLQRAEGGNMWRQMEAATAYKGAEASAPGFTFRITRNGIVRSDGVYLGRSTLDAIGLSRLIEASRYTATRRNRLHILRNGESIEYGRGEGFEIMSRATGARKVTFSHKDGVLTADGEFVVLRNGTYKRINGSSELLQGDVVITGQHLRDRLYKGDAFKVDIEGGVALLKNIASTGRSGIIYAGTGGPNPPKGILLKYLARSIASGSVNLLKSTGPILFKTVLSLGRASTRLPEYIRSRQERVIQRALERGEEGTIKLRSGFRVNGKIEIKADGEIVLTQYKNRERIKVFTPAAEGTSGDKLTPKTLGDNATLKLEAGMALQIRNSGEPLRVYSPKSSRPYHEQVSWNKGLGKFRLQETDDQGSGVWAPNLFDKTTKNNPLTKIEGNKATIFGEDGKALFQVELTKTYENGANVQKLIVRHLGEGDTVTEVTHLRPKLNSTANRNVTQDLIDSQKPVKLTNEHGAMIIDGPVSIRVGDKHFKLDEMFTGKRSLENASFIWSQLWKARRHVGESVSSYASRFGRSELMDKVMAYPKNWWENGSLRFNRYVERRTSWSQIKGNNGVFELESGFRLKTFDGPSRKIAVIQNADGAPISKIYVQRGSTDLTRAQRRQLSKNLKSEYVATDSSSVRKNQPFKLQPDGPTYVWNGKNIVRAQKASEDPIRVSVQVLRDSTDGTRPIGVAPTVSKEKVFHYSDIKVPEGKSVVVGRSNVADVALMHPSVQQYHAVVTREGKTLTISPKSSFPDKSKTQTYIQLPNGKKALQSEPFTAKVNDVVYFGHEAFKVVEVDGAPVLRHIQTTKETAAWLKTARGQKDRPISKSKIDVLDDSQGERSVKRWAAKHELVKNDGVSTKFDADGKIRLKNASGVEQVEILATRDGFLVTPIGVEPVFVKVNGSNVYAPVIGPTFINASDALRFGFPRDTRGRYVRWTDSFAIRPIEVSRFKATETFVRGYNKLSVLSPSSFLRSRIHRWAQRYEIQSDAGKSFKIDSFRNRFRIEGKAEIKATKDGLMLIPKSSEPVFIDRGSGFELVKGPTRIKGTERFRVGASEIYNPNTGKATNVFTLVGKAGSTELPTGLTRLQMAGKVIAFPIAGPLKLGAYVIGKGSGAIRFARSGATRPSRAISRWADNFGLKAEGIEGDVGNIKFTRGKVSLEKSANVKATKNGFTVEASGKEPIYVKRSGATDFEPDAITGAVELKPGDQIRIGGPIKNSEEGGFVTARIYTLEKRVATAPDKPEIPKAFTLRRRNTETAEAAKANFDWIDVPPAVEANRYRVTIANDDSVVFGRLGTADVQLVEMSVGHTAATMPVISNRNGKAFIEQKAKTFGAETTQTYVQRSGSDRFTIEAGVPTELKNGDLVTFGKYETFKVKLEGDEVQLEQVISSAKSLQRLDSETRDLKKGVTRDKGKVHVVSDETPVKVPESKPEAKPSKTADGSDVVTPPRAVEDVLAMSEADEALLAQRRNFVATLSKLEDEVTELNQAGFVASAKEAIEYFTQHPNTLAEGIEVNGTTKTGSEVLASLLNVLKSKISSEHVNPVDLPLLSLSSKLRDLGYRMGDNLHDQVNAVGVTVSNRRFANSLLTETSKDNHKGFVDFLSMINENKTDWVDSALLNKLEIKIQEMQGSLSEDEIGLLTSKMQLLRESNSLQQESAESLARVEQRLAKLAMPRNADSPVPLVKPRQGSLAESDSESIVISLSYGKEYGYGRAFEGTLGDLSSEYKHIIKQIDANGELGTFSHLPGSPSLVEIGDGQRAIVMNSLSSKTGFKKIVFPIDNQTKSLEDLVGDLLMSAHLSGTKSIELPLMRTGKRAEPDAIPRLINAIKRFQESTNSTMDIRIAAHEAEQLKMVEAELMERGMSSNQSRTAALESGKKKI